tara:strand:+ start:49 stop:543 length:495 start_codon:yes stop_codon:yes gene_type:complete
MAPLIYAAGAIVARFIAKKGLAAAIKKFTKKAISGGKKHADDLLKKDGGKTAKKAADIKKMKPVQAANANSRSTLRRGLGVAAVGVGVPSAFAIAKLRTNLKKAKTEKARIQAQKDIDNAVAKVVLAEEKAKNKLSAPSKSKRPQTRKTLAPSKSQRPKIRLDK